jgi:hypothetical protein
MIEIGNSELTLARPEKRVFQLGSRDIKSGMHQNVGRPDRRQLGESDARFNARIRSEQAADASKAARVQAERVAAVGRQQAAEFERSIAGEKHKEIADRVGDAEAKRFEWERAATARILELAKRVGDLTRKLEELKIPKKEYTLHFPPKDPEKEVDTGYDGPFAVTQKDATTLQIREGYVFAGDRAEYHFTDSSNATGFVDYPTTGLTANTRYLLVMYIDVDPSNGAFTTGGIAYIPTLYAVKAGTTYDVNPQNATGDPMEEHDDVSVDQRGCYQVIARLTVGATTGQVTTITQGQYGHIYVPVFYYWNIIGNPASNGGTPGYIDNCKWSAGWSHGHYNGPVVVDVPGAAYLWTNIKGESNGDLSIQEVTVNDAPTPPSNTTGALVSSHSNGPIETPVGEVYGP